MLKVAVQFSAASVSLALNGLRGLAGHAVAVEV